MVQTSLTFFGMFFHKCKHTSNDYLLAGNFNWCFLFMLSFFSPQNHVLELDFALNNIRNILCMTRHNLWAKFGSHKQHLPFRLLFLAATKFSFFFFDF